MQRHVGPSRMGEDVPVRLVGWSDSENRMVSDVALLSRVWFLRYEPGCRICSVVYEPLAYAESLAIYAGCE